MENEETGMRRSGSPARSSRAGSAVVAANGNGNGNGAVKEKRDRRSSSKEGVEGVAVPTVVMGKEREGSVGSGEWLALWGSGECLVVSRLSMFSRR